MSEDNNFKTDDGRPHDERPNDGRSHDNNNDQKYFFSDALRDTFKILKEKAGQAFLFMLIIWLTSAATTFFTEEVTIKTWTLLIGFPNMVVMTCIKIGLVVLVYNSFNQDPLPLSETIKKKFTPLLVTNIFLGIILGFIIMVFGLVVTGLLQFIFGSEAMMVISILVVLFASIYVAIHFAFITQGVVLGERYYADAINYSMTLSKDRGFTILGIIIFPELVTRLPGYLLTAYFEHYPLMMSFVTGLLTAITTVFSVVAITALYLHVKEEKEGKSHEDHEAHTVLND